jgi:DNA-binding MarR family transcriptional regulator
VAKIIQERKRLQPCATRSELLDALERGFREVSTAGIMLHQVVAERLGLNITDHKCMGMLCELGPLSAGKLAELTGLTTGAITGVLNRLERAGYARRIRNPKDRRNVKVEPQNVVEFHQKMEALLGPLGKKMRAMSAKYSAEELELFRDFMKDAIAISRDETLRLRSEDEDRG